MPNPPAPADARELLRRLVERWDSNSNVVDVFDEARAYLATPPPAELDALAYELSPFEQCAASDVSTAALRLYNSFRAFAESVPPSGPELDEAVQDCLALGVALQADTVARAEPTSPRLEGACARAVHVMREAARLSGRPVQGALAAMALSQEADALDALLRGDRGPDERLWCSSCGDREVPMRARVLGWETDSLCRACAERSGDRGPALWRDCRQDALQAYSFFSTTFGTTSGPDGRHRVSAARRPSCFTTPKRFGPTSLGGRVAAWFARRAASALSRQPSKTATSSPATRRRGRANTRPAAARRVARRRASSQRAPGPHRPRLGRRQHGGNDGPTGNPCRPIGRRQPGLRGFDRRPTLTGRAETTRG